MITDGSLRLLYLILDQFLSWLMLLGRAASGLVLRSMATWWRRTRSSMSRTLIERLARETDLDYQRIQGNHSNSAIASEPLPSRV